MKRDKYSDAAAQARVLIEHGASPAERTAGRAIKRLVAECRRLERLRARWMELAERTPRTS